MNKIAKEGIKEAKKVGISFGYDGCHKIYVCEDKQDEKELLELGYSILPMGKLEETYENSCGLRFIHNSKLTKSFVSQFEGGE